MAFITNTHVATKRGGGLKLAKLFSVWRQRQRLNQLDAAALRDIGITRAEAEAEAARAIWDVPATWRY
ncbi:MAG: DUF1127 domain-containing protein [Rhodobacteraceae bacterium]|nr:DUF1127 domain-containing protein [Paracoccaceae bacterium]